MGAASRRRHRTRPGGPGLLHASASRASLGAVLRAALLPVGDSAGVERRANDLVAVAREVLRRAAAYEHDGVLLQVVALARDVCADLRPVRQANACDLAQRRIRLSRRLRHDARAYAALLRRAGERGCLRLRLRGLPAFAHELIDSRQMSPFVKRLSAGAKDAPANGPAAW